MVLETVAEKGDWWGNLREEVLYLRGVYGEGTGFMSVHGWELSALALMLLSLKEHVDP
jgi:hypothetical protein